MVVQDCEETLLHGFIQSTSLVPIGISRPC